MGVAELKCMRRKIGVQMHFRILRFPRSSEYPPLVMKFGKRKLRRPASFIDLAILAEASEFHVMGDPGETRAFPCN